MTHEYMSHNHSPIFLRGRESVLSIGPRWSFLPPWPFKPPCTRPIHSMDIGGPSVCVCGRSFSKLSAFTNHKRTCQSSKKRLASALDKAKQLWQGSKRRRIQTDTPEVPTAPGLVLESSLATAEEVCYFFMSMKIYHSLIARLDSERFCRCSPSRCGGHWYDHDGTETLDTQAESSAPSAV